MIKKEEATTWLIVAAVVGGLAVGLGAFGAHVLKTQLTPYQIDIFRTGTDYQFYHALAIGLVSMLALHQPSRWLKYSFIFFLVGTIFFSGSLYLLATREVLGIDSWSKFLGPITPIGGVLYIAGWITLIFHGLHLQKHKS